MRSWRPKPLRIFSSAPYHHHAERKRNFDIRKHVSEPSPNAAKVAARYKHKPSRSVKEVKEPSPIGLPGARDAVIEQENRPRDFIRKIFFGAHKDENIAAFEQRHETILGILRGHGEYAGSEAARSKTKRAPTSTNQVLSRALTHKTKISSPQQTSPQQDDSVQLRRRRSFLGQAALLRGPRGILATPRERSNGRLDKRKQRPSQQTNITQDASSDTQALRSSLAPPAFRRLNLLSRDSTKSPRRILDTSRERSIGRSNKRKQRSSQQTKITQDASVGTQASQPSLASYGFRRLYLWSHDLTRSTVSSPGRPSKGKQQSPQQTKIIQDASVDTQAPEPSLAPRAFRRLNLWSRASAKSTKSSLGPLANECVGEEKIPHVAGKEHVTAHKRPHPKPAKGTKLESTTLVADEGSSRSNERKDDSAENAFLVYKDHQGDRQRLRLSPQDARGIAGRSQSVSVTADEISDKSKSRKLLKPNVSLFEELFPEEAAKHSSSGKGFVRKRHDIPKLSLPVVDEDDSFGDEYVRVPTSSTDQDKTLLQDAHRSWDPSFLVLQVASPSLIDSDFRRIAPKGQHISEWTGPGDYFKGS